MVSFKAVLILAAVAVCESRVVAGRQQKRQAAPADTVRALSVLAAQKRIYATQVTIQNLANGAARVAADVLVASAANATLIAQQAATYSSILAIEGSVPGTDFTKFNAAFLAQQKTNLTAANAAVASLIISGEIAYNASLVALQLSANADAQTAAANWNNAVISAPSTTVCNGVTCDDLINGGFSYCDTSNVCQYKCDNGNTALSAGPGVSSCLNTASDSNNCGVAGNVCQQPYNGIGSTICANSNCAVRCPASYKLNFLPSGQQFCSK